MCGFFYFTVCFSRCTTIDDFQYYGSPSAAGSPYPPFVQTILPINTPAPTTSFHYRYRERKGDFYMLRAIITGVGLYNDLMHHKKISMENFPPSTPLSGLIQAAKACNGA
jgi:hypothetical protein